MEYCYDARTHERIISHFIHVQITLYIVRYEMEKYGVEVRTYCGTNVRTNMQRMMRCVVSMCAGFYVIFIYICMCCGKVKMLLVAGCVIWGKGPENLMTLRYNPPCVIDTIYISMHWIPCV